MKLLRIGPAGSERPAAIHEGIPYDTSDSVVDYNHEFWIGGGLKRLHSTIERNRQNLPTIDLSAVRVGPPITKPSKVVCVGLNYEDHVRESGAEIPREPVVFMKAPNTVVGPNDDVLIPPGAMKTDYEIELSVVMGDTCRYLPDEAAAKYAIAGFAISNDLSEREYQLERDGQWVKGKSAETFNPLGPYLVTPDEVPNPQNLDLELQVNGETRQRSNTSEMIFSAAHIVWYLSQFMVLEPGDLINTGTPPGVALGLDPPRYIVPGDVMELSITGLGTQRQTCKQATP